MLWFKNLMVLPGSRDIALRAEEMEKQLASMTFTPCGSGDILWAGFADGLSQRCVATANGRYYLRAQKKKNPAIASDQTGAGGENPKLEADQGRKAEEDGKRFPEG